MEGLSEPMTGKASPTSRILTAQACDTCRLRKVRCQAGDFDRNTSFQGLHGANDDRGEEGNHPTSNQVTRNPCSRCKKHGLECSFLLPVRRRGPKGPRNRRLEVTTSHSPRPPSSSPDVQRDEGLIETNTPPPLYNRYSGTFDTSSPDFQPAQMFHLRSPSMGNHFNTSPTANTDREYSQHASISHTSPASALSHNHRSPYDAFVNVNYSTDDLCPRNLLLEMMEDYLRHLYPLLPVVHRPTFRNGLERKKDIQDKGFLSLLLALSAFTVACLPKRFKQYQRTLVPIRFQTRLEMIDHCYSKCIQLRGPRYFDEISHAKWAIPCLFYVAYFHIGEHNKSRMIESEAILFARLLGLHRVSAYIGLNLIETQLRKKAFWLMFYSYVHLQLQDHRKEKIAFIDCSMLHDLNLKDLLPVPQDDEQITEMKYLASDDSRPTLTAGFNLRSRLFWTAVASLPSETQVSRHTVHCHCTRLQQPDSHIEYLHSRLQELKYMLDNAPWYLRQWGPKVNDKHSDDSPVSVDTRDGNVFASQLTTIRADINVTHLWLQSMIMDQVDAFSTPAENQALVLTPSSPRSNWFAREDICHQLLLLLWSIPESSLEALGLYLVYKVRDVAVILLTCPFINTDRAEDVGPANRAKEYLKAFTDKLRELDKSETINSLSLQTWVDTDRNEAGKYYYW